MTQPPRGAAIAWHRRLRRCRSVTMHVISPTFAPASKFLLFYWVSLIFQSLCDLRRPSTPGLNWVHDLLGYIEQAIEFQVRRFGRHSFVRAITITDNDPIAIIDA